MNPEPPKLPETPWNALGPLVRDQVSVGDRTFTIIRPGESNLLLTHPAIKALFAADEYLPYWADLWPAARMLAEAVLREPWPEPPPRALELGCGLGLAGIAALARGLHVTFSDYDATALRFAADNAHANGFTDFEIVRLDWRNPPEAFGYPVVLGSDLIYEERAVVPLVALLKRVLLPDGVCLLTDQDRQPAARLREELTAAGLTFAAWPMRAARSSGERYKGTLYRIRHATTGGA